MSLKRLLNDVEDDVQYPDPSFISPHGSVSGSSYQSADDYSGNCPRRTSFQGFENLQEDPVIEDYSSWGDVCGNIIQFNPDNLSYDHYDLSANLDLVDGGGLEHFDAIQQWGDATMASTGGSYTSQPSPSGSGSSRDSLPATHSPSLAPESIVTGSDSCSSADEEVEKICYGMLYNVDVKLIGDMTIIDTKLTEAVKSGKTHQRFTLSEQQDHVLLAFKDGTDFGYLRSGPGKSLSPLLTQSSVEFEPIAPTATLRETIGRAKKPVEAMVKVDINVYGPRRLAQNIGDKLSEGKLWLQKPSHKRREVDYENPHMLQLDDLEDLTLEPVREVNGGAQAKRRSRENNLSDMMKEIYESLNRTRHHDKAERAEGLRNELLMHQQEALGFMLQRESGEIDERYQLWEPIEVDDEVRYRHRITNVKQRTKPDERGGGILADEMGMGKSLSILSLIMKTMKSGLEWAEHENSNEEKLKDVNYSGATLVVVSSAQVLIYNWMDEVEKHVVGKLKTIKYHGPNRERDIEKIMNSQIVVTTYNTLSAEFENKSSLLHKIGWYRVVLDEAHIIRRPATTFFHACKELHANSRWCLTGTPIQNKLADIGALFAFIRARPFDELAKFRKYIEVPFEQNVENPQKVKERLTMLLESLCLRRTKELLRLPGLQEVERKLDFSPEEREQYDKTKNILMRTIKQKVGEVEKSSKFGLFQANLQMRILCNHGTYQKPFSWHRRAYRLDEREAVASALGQNAEITCDGCHQPMPIIGSSQMGNEFEQCNHVFCSECLEESNYSAGAATSNGRHCPVCENWIKSAKAQRTGPSGVPVLRVDDVEMADASAEPSSMKDDENYFNPTGHSTKMQALIRDVMENLNETKSIIFSCWTRTLQLVAQHLQAANIEFLRIDGDCSLNQRQEMLREFSNSDRKRVLIMTTGTGAFGLNLTCANRVFIVELQWNPSVENQAIARAIRLGQGQKVLVTRYVINNTVEVEMSSQQTVKKNLAAIGFDENYDVEEMDES
ncbi:DNA repair and recombination protein rad5c [Colletotrichum karsti]|uniref:DNA repair and recombination protein rad5c n=1 Tax=Colletotrichum karsti TaxID=1095194 RepID=A0A9P6ICI0_9PEZI|nr:DNA repair and recombination protein rad5c [Colletotrichum karsti]KAF9878016.1 DNA repair and recombination protein rad5c [Colletotrichum karsti]